MIYVFNLSLSLEKQGGGESRKKEGEKGKEGGKESRIIF